MLSKGPREEFSGSFWWLLTNLGIPWLVEASFQSLPPSSHDQLPFMSIRLCTNSTLLILDLETTKFSMTLSQFDYIGKDPVSK